jgi:Zn-finger nucleic acid-binding protein
VWLDRGELDKIIERADGGDSGSRERDHDRDKYYKDDKYYKHKRKKSLLSELFD